MTIQVALNHKTSYTYDRAVNLSPHVIRLRPAAHSRTPIHSYSLKIKPDGHFINWQQDPFGNHIARLVFPEKTTSLKVEVEVIDHSNGGFIKGIMQTCEFCDGDGEVHEEDAAEFLIHVEFEQ